MSNFDFLKRGNNEKNKKWQNAEKRIESEVDGRIQPGSGSMHFAKGDVKGKKVLIECKQTEGNGFRITKKLLNKIEKEALEINAEGKIPVLTIEFSPDEIYYVIRDKHFEELGGKLE